MRITTAVMAMTIAGCSSMQKMPHEDIHRIARWNFRYKREESGKNEWIAYESIYHPFQGDCEDYAFTLQKEIGGQVRYTRLPSGGHAVLVKDGIVYDNMKKRPYPVEDLGTNLGYILEYKGEYIRNGE